MNFNFNGAKLASEGYIYFTYGDKKYLLNALASVTTLRRYDASRRVVLFCSHEHKMLLEENAIEKEFDYIFLLPHENQSINGFKHNLHQFLPFERNIIIDSDTIWCKNPDALWCSFACYGFTITGNQKADLFFGSSKGLSVLVDILLFKRQRTLKRFNLTYLSRVQAGMIYISDAKLAENVCEEAKKFFEDKNFTHFRSRKEESGRNDESCEWSLSMAMSRLKLQVYPWLNGYHSPQLDYIDSFTIHDENFNNISYLLYSDRFVYDLKGLKSKWLQKILLKLITYMPGKGDYMYVTPYCLHFGWMHQKKYLRDFSERTWQKLNQKKKIPAFD
ncbi:MAG: hypothetical protein EA359_04555 [Balneolaceae bacterium]|nr:MAG: hypothetical protein EA359_04555 [Balneolaceae bacterium]